MNMSKFYNILCSALVLASLAACKKDDSSAPAGGDTKQPVLKELTDTEINGTVLGEGIDLAGVITDQKTGKGIAGIAVSDGYQYVKTDANGVYQMKKNDLTRKVYYTVPAEYQIPLDDLDHLPLFYSSGIMTKGKAYRCDFKLKKLDAPETDFTLVMIGDPQCQTIDDAARFLGETVPDIKKTIGEGNYPNVYAVSLGDITFDSFYMFDPMVRCMRNVVINNRYLPLFNLPGNHDHDSMVKSSGDCEMDDYNSVEEYVKHFGPVDYSFDRGNAHIVMMDNVFVNGISSSSSPNSKTWNYSNELTDAQLEWLKQDIECVENPESKLIIFCVHQPVRKADVAQYAPVMELLSKFSEAHIMVGHTHYTQNYIHEGEKEVYEHIHGAACGAWWNANSNVTGAPNGYSIYNVKGSKVMDWVLKPTNRPMDYQMRVYNGNQQFGPADNEAKQMNWYSNFPATKPKSGFYAKGNAAFKNSLVAEVFDDDPKYWTVELWQNGAKVGDFTRAADGTMSNMAIAAFWYNNKNKTTDTWSNSTASHYWYFTPESGAPETEENWEVRATRTYPNGGTVTYTCNKLTTDFSEF